MKKKYYFLAVIALVLIGVIAGVYLLPPKVTLPSSAGTGPIDLTYQQGGIWLTPEEIGQIPTNNEGWDSLVTWANQPMDIVAELPCTAGGDDCDGDCRTTRVLFAKSIVGLRTRDQAMLNQAKAELDRVPEAIRRLTQDRQAKDMKWGQRNIALLAVSANLLDYRPQPLTDALHFIVREYMGWEQGYTVEYGAYKGLGNLPSHGRWTLMAVAYLTEDFTTVNEVVKTEAKFLGERTWGGTPNDHQFQLSSSGTEDNWQNLQPGRKRDPIGIMPAGISWQGRGVGGLYLADQYRSGSGPVWPPKYTNYIYEGLGPNIAIAFAADHLGYKNVFQLGNYALLRALLFQYSTHDGKDSWAPEQNDVWETAAIMTWAEPLFGSSLPADLLPEPGAPVPWPIPVRAGGDPGRSMGFMYATHYARLGQ